MWKRKSLNNIQRNGNLFILIYTFKEGMRIKNENYKLCI